LVAWSTAIATFGRDGDESIAAARACGTSTPTAFAVVVLC
jgi:hypothetical protein